ncbi:DUF962 domain-containing protein [Acinetobacter sp. S40]|uniref:Mpo1 family 2-hydroxy fatty acid dioxygenase n=1 Tax=Acinetobacter sp. S40 TaxID=2767434 RepID=UPI00190D467B|nr:Mpo1-like protein [Acinetobacter sp. S40]MBJ9985086.1 DUF962 domain-containing protein [Acinetobacter sp. S40]
MSKLEQLLSQYAAYHLDQKNVMTHFIGIPLIVFALFCLAARVEFSVGQFHLHLVITLLWIMVVYYLRLDYIFGLMMLFILGACTYLALEIAQLDIWLWLSISIGSFIIGWIFQFIGHFFEKKKPAFVDDIVGLAIGPLFVLAEFVFLLGFRKSLKDKVLEQAHVLRKEMDKHSSLSAKHI